MNSEGMTGGSAGDEGPGILGLSGGCDAVSYFLSYFPFSFRLTLLAFPVLPRLPKFDGGSLFRNESCVFTVFYIGYLNVENISVYMYLLLYRLFRCLV